MRFQIFGEFEEDYEVYDIKFLNLEFQCSNRTSGIFDAMHVQRN